MLDYNKKLTFSFFRFSYLRTREWRKWRIYIFNNLTNESEFENLNYYFFCPPAALIFHHFQSKNMYMTPYLLQKPENIQSNQWTK